MMPPAFLHLTVLPTGRQLVFTKEFADAAHIFRRVGGAPGPWVRLVANARSPYLDTDVFARGTSLAYYVQLATRYGDEEARSPVVQVCAPALAEPNESVGVTMSSNSISQSAT